jgi:hypothetical protein
MSDFNFYIESISDYATKDQQSGFNKILPEEKVILPTTLRRVVYKTRAGTTQLITLKRKNEYHEIIFRTILSSIQSDWFETITDSTKSTYLDSIRKLFNWINETGYKTDSGKRYSILKDFEVYEMNELGMKHGGIKQVTLMLNRGLDSSTFSMGDLGYISTLLSLTKQARRAEPEPITLSNWFDIPWISEVIGEKQYLQLESPRLLINSFRITVATTLFWLLEQRKKWKKNPTKSFDCSYSQWYSDWNRMILIDIGRFSSVGEPEDELSQLLFMDFVIDGAATQLKEEIKILGGKNLPKRINFNKNWSYPWKKPILFHPAYQTEYSPIEELLCAWLMASEAIQPTDIEKLKVNNILRHKNNSGRLMALEISYFKGRSGGIRDSKTLMGRDTCARAIDLYLAGLKDSTLFNTNIAAHQKFPKLETTHNILTLLYKIWKLPEVAKRINSEHKRADSKQIFSNVMFSLECGGENYNQFYKRTKKTTDEYRELVYRNLPVNIFTLTAIKTSAVHSRSDTYRDADLINHNSHTSMSERTSYLTDANKEWLNQSGRITRLVIHDLQNVVYQPSIKAIINSVVELELRTNIIESTKSKDIRIHNLYEIPDDKQDSDEVIIADVEDNALYFIHYINQAEVFLPMLLAVRPDWVERTLIINVEWMTRTLIRMKSSSIAKKKYASLKIHLPNLFSHILETTE